MHGAVYEFQRPEALAAVKQAYLRGAKVRVLYDDIVSYFDPADRSARNARRAYLGGPMSVG